MERRETSETRTFWGRVFAALSRLLAFLIFAGAHWGVTRLLKLLFPPSMARVVDLVEVVTSIFFVLVYLYLGWEMLTCFFPFLKRKAYAVINGSEQKSES